MQGRYVCYNVFESHICLVFYFRAQYFSLMLKGELIVILYHMFSNFFTAGNVNFPCTATCLVHATLLQYS